MKPAFSKKTERGWKASVRVIKDNQIFTVSFKDSVSKNALAIECPIQIYGYTLPRYRPIGTQYWHHLESRKTFQSLTLGDNQSIEFNLQDMELGDWLYVGYPVCYYI